ncbi:MAG: hypothetical protein ACT4PS_15495 [Betaproteobacteria bacterium]
MKNAERLDARSSSNYNAVYNLHAVWETSIRLAGSRFSLLRRFDHLAAVVVITSAAIAPNAGAADFVRSGGPYVPTPQEVVDRMLEVAAVSAEDFVMDLGSGDGRSVTMDVDEKYGSAGAWQSTIYLWIVPAKVEGRWSAETHESDARRYVLSLVQTFQHVAGEAHAGATRIPIKDAHIAGSRIRFALPAVTGGPIRRFSGTIAGDRITGVIESPAGSVPWSATRIDTAVSLRHSR